MTSHARLDVKIPEERSNKATHSDKNPEAVPSLSIRPKCLRIRLYLHHFATEENI